MATYDLTDEQVGDIIDSINDRLEMLEERVDDSDETEDTRKYFRETITELEAIKDVLDPAGAVLRASQRTEAPLEDQVNARLDALGDAIKNLRR